MQTTNLDTLKINVLTEAQYSAEKSAGTIDETALYMTPNSGIAPITQGGTGATTAAAALANLGVTYSTTDLTAGTSSLATGALYFVYE